VKLKLIALSLLATTSIVAHADDGNPKHTKFKFLSEEVVLDLASGKSWMRCPVGYTVNNQGTVNDFTDDSCDVVSTTSYSFDATKNIEGQGDYADWRVPGKTDVVAMFGLMPNNIIQDKNVFPETQAGKFWFDEDKVSNGEHWVADPMNRSAQRLPGTEKYEIRLISDGAIDPIDS
jgi:hypothetical protein